MQTLFEWLIKLVAMAAAIILLYYCLPAMFSAGTMPYLESYLPRPAPGMPTSMAAFMAWLLRFVCAGLVTVAALVVMYALGSALTNSTRRRLN